MSENPMTAMERRCVDAVDGVEFNNDNTYRLRLVRAVLAEAGVTDMVEALHDIRGAVTKGAPSVVRANVRDIVDAALAKARP